MTKELATLARDRVMRLSGGLVSNSEMLCQAKALSAGFTGLAVALSNVAYEKEALELAMEADAQAAFEEAKADNWGSW